MLGFISWARARQISLEVDNEAGAHCRMVGNLIQAGFWRRVEGGFQVLALAKTGTRTPAEIESEAKRLTAIASLTPADRNYRLSQFIYGLSSPSDPGDRVLNRLPAQAKEPEIEEIPLFCPSDCMDLLFS